ncbi:acyl-CoA N-acyltransferase [Lenzites betulinus]|nr:acyl-CoA N-acyltransferase [Lenzites betulinus]
MSIFCDPVMADELDDVFRIETAGYPADEAGSREIFRYRQSQAPELFLGAFVPVSNPEASGRNKGRTLIGYICATLSPDTTLTHKSMSTHVPGSSSICIHSVCVDQAHRRQHVGLNLVNAFVARAEAAARAGAGYERVLLIVHEELQQFYAKAGFTLVGLSHVVHGARPWYEMRKDLVLGVGGGPRTSSTTTLTPPSIPAHTQAQTGPPEAQALPAGLWEALERSSRSARPTARTLSSFPNAIRDVVTDINEGGVGGLPANKQDLLCPRPGCGSVILKDGVASWVERASVQIDSSAHALPEWLGVLPAPPATAQWWLVKPNAMAFENIGFTRAVQATGPGGRKLKLLACAECELGPLGWCEEGGNEFWLACNRVGYRV